MAQEPSDSSAIGVHIPERCTSVAASALHLLPCEISLTGPAAVKTFFRPSDTPHNHSTSNSAGVHGSFEIPKPEAMVVDSGSEKKTKEIFATFRGRELTGKTVKLPENSLGLVVTNSDEMTDENCKKWKMTHEFSEFTLWNRDTSTERDALGDTVGEWMSLANAVRYR